MLKIRAGIWMMICVMAVFLLVGQVQAWSFEYRTVSATISGWQDTGLSVQKGSNISISAERKDEDKNSNPTEQVWYGGGNHVGGADGCRAGGGHNADENALAPGLRHMALVGKIGDGDAFYVGKSCQFIADRPGKLYLGCNDALNEKDSHGYRDNSGEITVKIMGGMP